MKRRYLALLLILAGCGGGGGSQPSGRIVWSGVRAGDFRLISYDVKTRVATQILSNTTQDVWPVVSPDGSKVAFSRYVNEPDESYALFVMNSDGTDVRRLTNSTGQKRATAWSPDGTRIMFTRWFENGTKTRIFVIGADGSGLSQVPGGRPINDAPLIENAGAWSPDGTKIAFASNLEDTVDLYVRSADGTGAPTRLTHTNGHETSVRWSPGGRELLFVEEGVTAAKINVDGSNRRALPTLKVQEADWSPDGSQIVFSTNRAGFSQIYTMNADGSSEANIVGDANDNIAPSWSR